MDAPEHYRHSELEVAPPFKVPCKPLSAQPDLSYSGGSSYQAPEKMRTIWGLRFTTFFLILALILVILAAGIGGGVGGSMAVKSARNSNKAISAATTVSALCAPTTSAPCYTSASASAFSVPTAGTVYLNCPAIDKTILSVTLETTSAFTVTCGEDFGPGGVDIIAVTVYTIEDCARACASYNLNWHATICKGATFNSYLAEVQASYGTCFLKNNTAGATLSKYQSYAGLSLN